jgi:penicillin-binding protein 1A
MAAVYSTLADGGWRNAPIAITKVVFPDGHVDESWGKPHRVKVLSDGITSEETSILHQNVLSGTAVRSAISCPTAAKTGTTTELVDGWLDGYTPRYATVVWMGYPNKRIPMTDVHGEPQQGGALPAQIWKTYMSAVTEGEPCVEFPQPTEPLSYQPFFGHYATTGRYGSGEQTGEESFEHGTTPGAGQGTGHAHAHHESPGATPRETPEAPTPGAGAPREPATPAPATEQPAPATEPERHAERHAEPEQHAPAATPAPTGGAEPRP